MRYMDYEEFSNEYKKYEMWNDNDEFSQYTDNLLWGNFKTDPIVFGGSGMLGGMANDTISFSSAKNNIQRTGFIPDDRVNSPSHYTSGRMEAIDIIEDAISTAPTPGKGLLQAQVLKYILRLWLKDSPVEDAKKAEWYLKRLIDSLE